MAAELEFYGNSSLYAAAGGWEQWLATATEGYGGRPVVAGCSGDRLPPYPSLCYLNQAPASSLPAYLAISYTGGMDLF